MLIDNFLHLFLESAPWLLLGLVLAGLLKVFVPMSWMNKQLGGHGLKATIKAALFGAPLPLCSCGVIPAAVGLRRSGASKAATTSFMVSTPETGIDSVNVSYVLLGPFMAIVRPIAAVTSAVVAGLLVGRDKESKQAIANGEQPEQHGHCASSTETSADMNELHQRDTSVVASDNDVSCCSHHSNNEASAQLQAQSCSSASKDKPDANSGSCCSHTEETAAELKSEPFFSRIGQGLQYAATDLVRDTAVWLLIGLFFAALVQTYVPGDFLAKWGDGILAMLVMVIISVPMYICATASTPIAAGLLLAGVSPGAVLVFMLTGPATNIATLGVIVNELGKRALYGYLAGVLGVALVAGVLVNALVANFGFEVMPQIGEHHQLLPEWLVASSGLLLAALMLRVLWKMLPFKSTKQDCCG